MTSTARFRYTAYGLHIGSEIELPHLQPSEEAPNVMMRRVDLGKAVQATVRDGRIVRADADEVLLYYEQVGAFRMRRGRTIEFDPESGLPDETLQSFLTSVCMGVVLHQRNRLVLHGSAVSVHGQAAGFVGEKGMGKSTTAAALQARGHAFITDDLLVVESASPEQTPRVVPSFPQIKLWPDALRAAGLARPDDLPRVHPSAEKRIGRAALMVENAVPLNCLFALRTGDQISMEPLPVQSAFAEMIRHSYLRRLLEPTGTSVRHFRQVNQLLKGVPVVAFARPRDFTQLPAAMDAIERHMDTLHKQA